MPWVGISPKRRSNAALQRLPPVQASLRSSACRHTPAIAWMRETSIGLQITVSYAADQTLSTAPNHRLIGPVLHKVLKLTC